MLKYVIKRVLMVVPVMIGVSIIVFSLMRVFSPDPAPIVLGQHATEESMQAWREANGLNDPVVTQYFTYVGNALKDNLAKLGVQVVYDETSHLPVNAAVYRDVLAKADDNLKASLNQLKLARAMPNDRGMAFAWEGLAKGFSAMYQGHVTAAEAATSVDAVKIWLSTRPMSFCRPVDWISAPACSALSRTLRLGMVVSTR